MSGDVRIEKKKTSKRSECRRGEYEPMISFDFRYQSMDMLPQTVALTPQGYISLWTGGNVNPKIIASTLHADKGERQCF